MDRSNTTLSIAGLVSKVKDGSYRVPTFQRDYVWNEEDVRKLAESILKKVPIGSILTWRTRVNREMTKGFAGVERPRYAHDDAGVVIDGQQRITTLFHIVSGVETYGRTKNISPASKLYLHIKKCKSYLEGGKRLDFNIIDLFSEDPCSSEYIKLSDVFTDKISTHGHDNMALLYEVRSRFETYQVNVEEIVNGTLIEAVGVFELVNTTGKPLDVIDVRNALCILDNYHTLTVDLVNVNTTINKYIGRNGIFRTSSPFYRNVEALKITDEYVTAAGPHKDIVLGISGVDIQDSIDLIKDSYEKAAQLISSDPEFNWRKMPAKQQILNSVARLFYIATDDLSETQLIWLSRLVNSITANEDYVNLSKMEHKLFEAVTDISDNRNPGDFDLTPYLKEDDED